MIAKKKAMLRIVIGIDMVDGVHVSKTDNIEVEIMHQEKKWLMVRRPGCIPFVAHQNQLVDSAIRGEGK